MQKCDLRDTGLFQEMIREFDDRHHRCVECTKMNHLSSWFMVLPVSQNHFDLTAQEFRDALALRYRKPF